MATAFSSSPHCRDRDTDAIADHVSRLLTEGGDGRIVPDARSGLNKYLTASRPTRSIAYASSTANHISAPAFAEIQRRYAVLTGAGPIDAHGYADALDRLRTRIAIAFQLPRATDIMFAASGTDLEFVALALARRDGCAGIDNVLLGADEVGSGCELSAQALNFGDVTPLGTPVTSGTPFSAELAAQVRLVDIPIREQTGAPTPSEDLLLSIASAVDAASRAGRQALIHVVHGSKTGLIIPSMAHIDALRRRYGDAISFVVDACQARIDRETIVAYLSRGAMLLLTGSKYMGGPPFSGIALVPGRMVETAQTLPAGFETGFSRHEWTERVKGRDRLPETANPGLLLRLEASIFELELYQRLEATEIRRTINLFDEAVGDLTMRLGVNRILQHGHNVWHEARHVPQELRTLVTLDLTELRPGIDHDMACVLHRRMALHPHHPVRLGQPVKCLPQGAGRFAGTLRIGLSMPQMVTFASMSTESARQRLRSDMAEIGDAILREAAAI